MGKIQEKQDPQSRAPDCLVKVGVFVYYLCIKMAGVHLEAVHVKLKGYLCCTNCVLLLPSGLPFYFPLFACFCQCGCLPSSPAKFSVCRSMSVSEAPTPLCVCVRARGCARVHACSLSVSAHLHHLHSVVIWPLLCATGFLWKCHAGIFSD